MCYLPSICATQQRGKAYAESPFRDTTRSVVVVSFEVTEQRPRSVAQTDLLYISCNRARRRTQQGVQRATLSADAIAAILQPRGGWAAFPINECGAADAERKPAAIPQRTDLNALQRATAKLPEPSDSHRPNTRSACTNGATDLRALRASRSEEQALTEAERLTGTLTIASNRYRPTHAILSTLATPAFLHGSPLPVRSQHEENRRPA